MKEFYSPGEVHFTKQTVLWLLQNLGCLGAGEWPTDASNYIDIPGKKVGNKAYYQTPIEYAAEIEERLERCGIDGLILEAIESWGKTDESLARYFKMPVWSIRKRRKKALIYVSSGQDRRWHDTKKRKGVSYDSFRGVNRVSCSDNHARKTLDELGKWRVTPDHRIIIELEGVKR